MALTNDQLHQMQANASKKAGDTSVSRIGKVVADKLRIRKSEAFGQEQAQRQAAREADEQARIKGQQKLLDDIRSSLPATLEKVGVPPHRQEVTFADCSDIPKNILDKAHAWTKAPRGLLYIHGITGCGKSTLAVAMLGELLTLPTFKPSVTQYISQRRYIRGVKAKFGNKPDTIPPEYAIHLLVYDDMGDIRLTDFVKDAIDDLVEERHDFDLPTIITSNLSLNEVAENIDPRIASRIIEWNQVWELPAADFRLKGKR